jgi:hypothetical protein
LGDERRNTGGGPAMRVPGTGASVSHSRAAELACPWCGRDAAASAHRCVHCGRLLAPWLERGHLVAQRYEVEAPLGSGGMGIVYRVRDRLLDEVLALKILGLGLPDDGLSERLRQEIKLARRVSHENVCRLHEYGEDGRIHYVSMELVEGVDLKRGLLSQGPPSVSEALDVALQVVAGLEAIHRAGILHRDLKSANIMRDRSGLVKLMDFGIAKALGARPVAITHEGQIVGSPEYMSPEQARGGALDVRSDIYSLGVVLFELFTGRVPFQGDSPLATVLKHLNEPPPLDGPEGNRLPQALLSLLGTALAKSPADRHASASELARALREVRVAEASVAITPTVTCIVQTPVSDAALPAGIVAPAGVGRRRRLTPWLASAAAIAAVALAAGWLTARRPLDARDAGAGTPSAARIAPLASGVRAVPPSAPVKAAPHSSLLSRTSASPIAGAPTPSPIPTPQYAEPADPSLEVPIGTALAVRITTELRSDRTRPGSPFEALLDEPLVLAGRQVAAAGAGVTGRVLGAGLAAGVERRPFLELALSSVVIGGRPVAVRTGLYRLVAPAVPAEGPNIVAVVIGAAAGGLVGGAAGGRSGALAGAGAGAAAALAASPHESFAEYRVGNRLTFKLAEPLAVDNDVQWRTP